MCGAVLSVGNCTLDACFVAFSPVGLCCFLYCNIALVLCYLFWCCAVLCSLCLGSSLSLCCGFGLCCGLSCGVGLCCSLKSKS